jgi:hypothetical protein
MVQLLFLGDKLSRVDADSIHAARFVKEKKFARDGVLELGGVS